MRHILVCQVCKKSFDRREYDVGHKFCSIQCCYWDSVDENAPGCWLWPKRIQNGYGLIKWKGKRYHAHKIGYTAMLELPEMSDEMLFNTCGNRSCARGNHWTTDTSWKWTFSKRYK